MGGPPGLLNLNCLAATKRKRVGRTRSAQQEDEEEEEEASDVFSRKRVLRRKRKKRSEFLRTMSDTGSESEGGQNSSYTSGLDSSCASEAEEEDCPTDPATLSMLLERFTVSSNPSIGFATFKESTVESTLEERRGLNADEASVRLYLMSLFRKLYIASHSVRYTPCYLGRPGEAAEPVGVPAAGGAAGAGGGDAAEGGLHPGGPGQAPHIRLPSLPHCRPPPAGLLSGPHLINR